MLVLCPFHKEDTPSCKIYENGYHCFGCGKSGKLEEIGKHGKPAAPRVVEDLQKASEYIESLPRVEIRGLTLPSDGIYFYIPFPGSSYYKKRAIKDTEERRKYIGPSGHEVSLFIAQEGEHALVVVEGELNALSLVQAGIPFTIVSPGGAGCLAHKRHMPYYSQFKSIIIVADADKAGNKGATLLAIALLSKPAISVKTILLKTDFNDILVTSGKEKVQETFLKGLEMHEWMRS